MSAPISFYVHIKPNLNKESFSTELIFRMATLYNGNDYQLDTTFFADKTMWSQFINHNKSRATFWNDFDEQYTVEDFNYILETHF